VIRVRAKTVRFAIHLIFNIRTVLGTKLPVQIVYAGDDDLPSYSRDHLREVEPDLEFIDILTVFDDKSMGLSKDWAINPFAALASTFETVILMDADTIFLQKPEVLLDDSQYKETGAFFFLDRLIWKSEFKDRHDWWKQEMQLQTPSEILNKSLVWTEDYAEETDSGVLILDKSRFHLCMELLHVC
jgi:alpha 1,3-mannosyltransferase